MNEEIAEGMTYVSLDELTTPQTGEVIIDAWWAVHPEKGAMFFDGYAPQCNRNEQLSRRLARNLYPECEVTLIPVAFIPRTITERASRE